MCKKISATFETFFKVGKKTSSSPPWSSRKPVYLFIFFFGNQFKKKKLSIILSEEVLWLIGKSQELKREYVISSVLPTPIQHKKTKVKSVLNSNLKTTIMNN